MAARSWIRRVQTGLQVLGVLSPESAGASAPKLDHDSLLRKLDGPRPPLVLDVRTPREYAGGHVPGAVNIPHTQLAGRLDELDRQREIVVYCESGGRTRMSVADLLDAGFPHVFHLEGDMRAWREAGRPTER